MDQDFIADAIDDLFADATRHPARTRSRLHDAYDDAFEAYEEDIDEAVYPVVYSPTGGGLFRVDTSVDIAQNPAAIQNALTAGQHAPGIWVTGGERNAAWAARQGGFPGYIRHEPHLRPPPVGVGQPHIHGTNGGQRSAHIFYGKPPAGDFADFDALETALVEALGADDTDEFFRRVVRGVRRMAQGGSQSRGQARVVSPVASALALSWPQAIGRVASVASRLMADGADAFEAIDTLVDLAADEDVMDAAVPAIATLAMHSTMPRTSRLPTPVRQQLVRATTRTAHIFARQQGPQAMRALPAVLQAAQLTTRRQRLPPHALPRLIQRIGQRLSRNPHMIRRLAQSARAALR